MGKTKKQEIPIWAKMGHAKPTTRREFLGYGIIPFAARAFVPGALGLLGTALRADAAECPPENSVLSAFITLNLSGGAGLSANFLGRDAGGQLLPSYSKMGGGTPGNITMTSEFGHNGWQQRNAGSVINGIRARASAQTLANTAFLAVCVQSQDDSGNNQLDATGLVYKAGLVGSRIPNVGTRATATGINQRPAFLTPPAPLRVGSFNDVVNSIGYTAALNTNLNVAQRQKVAGLVNSLSSSQAKKLASISTTAHVKDLVECAGIKNEQLVRDGAGAVDPRQNAQMSTLWAVNAGTAANNENLVFATMVYNGLLGQAGTVNLERGGYDYHDGTAATGDQRDQQAGEVIGRILESARILNRKVFLYVTSDGSVVSPDSNNPNAIWTSDRGSAGMSLLFMYDPAGRVSTTSAQVGHYTAGQVADDTTLVGNSPANSAQAVFANYLQFNGKMDLFSKAIPRGTLEPAQLAQLIKVG